MCISIYIIFVYNPQRPVGSAARRHWFWFRAKLDAFPNKYTYVLYTYSCTQPIPNHILQFILCLFRVQCKGIYFFSKPVVILFVLNDVIQRLVLWIRNVPFFYFFFFGEQYDEWGLSAFQRITFIFCWHFSASSIQIDESCLGWPNAWNPFLFRVGFFGGVLWLNGFCFGAVFFMVYGLRWLNKFW